MRMSHVCVGIAGLWALFGLVPAAWMAIELAVPGLAGDPRVARRLYAAAALLHAPAMMLAFPVVSTAALGAALFAEAGRRPVWGVFSVGLVVLAGLGVAISIPPGGPSSLRDVAESEAIVSGVIILSTAGIVFAALAIPSARSSTLVLGVLAVIALVPAAGLAWLRRHGGAESVLSDTWLVVAVQHAAGTALLIAALAVLTAWASRTRAPPALAISIGLGLTLFAGGLVMAFAAMRLGFAGMPRGHADYAAGFASGHRLATFGSALAGAGLFASLVRLVLIVRSPTQAELTTRTFD